MRQIYILLLCVLVTANGMSQAPGIKWQRCVGGSDNESMYDLNGESNGNFYNPIDVKSLVLPRSGGYLIAGQVNSWNGDLSGTSTGGTGTIAIVRLDASRNVTWKKQLGGGSNSPYVFFTSMTETADSGCIVLGHTGANNGQAVGNHGGQDALIGKFSKTGTMEWFASYGGASHEYTKNIVQLADSGYVFIANTQSTSGQVQGNHGGFDMWLVRLDKAGNILWQKCIGGAGDNYGVKLLKTSTGFAYIWTGANCSGYTFTRTDTAGTTVGETCITGMSPMGSINAIAGGGYIVAGQGAGSSGMAIKLDSAGNTVWTTILNGSSTDMFQDAQQTADGGFIVAGNTRSNNGDLRGLGLRAPGSNFGQDAWIVKLDGGGQVQWQKLFGGSNNDAATTIFPLANGDFVFLGETNSYDGDVSGLHGGVDWWLAELSPANNVSGYVFADDNSNGMYDAGEAYVSNVQVKSVKGTEERVTVPVNGQYTNYIDTGSYTTTIDPYVSYYTMAVAPRNTTFTTYNNTDTFNVPLQPIPGIKDLAVNVFDVNRARPGFPMEYKIRYENKGTTAIATGKIAFVTGTQLTYTSASPVYNSTSADTLFWNFSNLAPHSIGLINVDMTVKPPPAVNGGDSIQTSAIIFPIANDTVPVDNKFEMTQRVFNAFDPNDKTESHAGKISTQQLTDGEYLQYTIRFQNTGTDTAFNVFIRDTLSSSLDWNTFEMLTASADYHFSMSAGKCLWEFNNIRLPDSNHSQAASYGYLVYRIKPTSAVAVGDVITNKAAIYFDNNLPVLTKIDSTTVVPNLLPLRLLNFNASKEGTVNKLVWSTAGEIDVDRFEIERSASGREYNAIGSTRAGTNNYAFVDRSPLKGVNFYRLKIIDKDGRSEYSPVRMVNNNGSFSVRIYPNPVKDKLQVMVESEKKANLLIQILTQDGRLIQATHWLIEEGNTIKSLHVEGLRSGSYFLKVMLDKEEQVIKFEKVGR